MLKMAMLELFRRFKFEMFAFKTHRINVYKARKRYKKRRDLKLHFACGYVYKEGWVNIDLMNKGADLHLDLRSDLPFEENSCEEIYSEHFLEHLSYPDGALYFLSQLHHIIKPGGKVVTGVPDTEWPMRSYSSDGEYFKIVKQKDWHPDHLVTRVEHINYHFRQDGEHLFAYDEETLIHILKRAGFTKNIVRPFDPEMDSASRQPGSLYVESYKE